MRNHTLMQTIARANRVFPDKDNGLIVDYIGVFRNLEKALAIYGAANAEAGVDSPIQDVAHSSTALSGAIDDLVEFCASNGVDLIALRDATGFEHIALRDAAVEALLRDDETRTTFLAAARQVRKLFKAVLPDPKAAAQQHTVAAIRVLAERIADVSRPPETDLDTISDAVDALLDRSVGAEEYVIRAAAEGSEPDPLIDLSQIDFDALAAGIRRTQAGRDRPTSRRLLKQRAVAAATRNPTRYDLVERIEELIAEYNAGSVNIDEYLRRLIALSKTLTDEEQRAVAEELTEEELAIFDLLTKPEPMLTDAERELVKASAKRLLAHLHDKLVLDWRRKAATTADVRTTIRDVLDADLPADPYPPDVFDTKVQAVFDHVITAYGDDGSSVYQGDRRRGDDRGRESRHADRTRYRIDHRQRGRANPHRCRVRLTRRRAAGSARWSGATHGRRANRQRRGLRGRVQVDCALGSSRRQSRTRRWRTPSSRRSPASSTPTAAPCSSASTTPGAVLGLDHDYDRVQPKNGDGFVNWLTTHLINALGHTPVTRVRARIAVHDGKQICRVDVARHNGPVWAKTSKGERVLFVRFNNSTRAVPVDEIVAYVSLRWPT